MSLDDPLELQNLLKTAFRDAYGLSLEAVLDTFGYFEGRKVLLARSDRGLRVVKLHEMAEGQARFKQTLQMMAHLQARGYRQVPEVYQTRHGDLYVEAGGVLLYLLEYFPQSPIQPCHPQDWQLLGAAAGQLNLIQDEPLEYAIPVDLAILEIQVWAQGQEYEQPIRDLLDLVKPLLADRQLGLIHGEINPANAGKRATGEVALLDWDEVGTGRIALELGYPLISLFLSVGSLEFQMDNARAFYGGYRAVTGLPWNREAIFAAALFHALRYLRFFDLQNRWQRILFAVAHRDQLLACLE